MNKLDLKQSTGQNLSLKQIQFIKLLQVPGFRLAEHIHQEIEENPLLEEDYETTREEEVHNDEEDKTQEEDDFSDEFLNNDDIGGYKMEGDGKVGRRGEREIPIPASKTYIEDLQSQLGLISLNQQDYMIGRQIIGSIDEHGYMRRELRTIVNDLILLNAVRTTEEHIESVLKKIQTFSPPGVGARNLQECLVIQMKQVSPDQDHKQIALKILTDNFESFTRKHYEKIKLRLNLTEAELKAALKLILSLNPKPIRATSTASPKQYLKPDFIVYEVKNDLIVELLEDNAINLKINNYYLNILRQNRHKKNVDSKTKETLNFIRYKLNSAKSFMDAINQRRDTLLNTMKTIANFQREFFKYGSFEYLKPMILMDIANIIKMDISTVSRIVNSKSVQTKFGVFMLKQFFSESVESLDGERVSNKRIKYVLKRLVAEEDKKEPYSDEELVILLSQKGFKTARRTVAKYRQQMKIPVARLRRVL